MLQSSVLKIWKTKYLKLNSESFIYAKSEKDLETSNAHKVRISSLYNNVKEIQEKKRPHCFQISYYKRVFNIIIVIDDFLDNVIAMKDNNLLDSLYIRGRHSYISVLTSSQVYKGVSSVVRKKT